MGDFLVFCAALGMMVLCATELGGAARKRGRLQRVVAALPILIVLFVVVSAIFILSETKYALAAITDSPLLAVISIFLAVFALSQVLYVIGVTEANPPIVLVCVLLGGFALAEIVYAFGIIETDPLIVVERPLNQLRDFIFLTRKF